MHNLALISTLSMIPFLSCSAGNKENTTTPPAQEITISDEAKSYWYTGEAEITSYALKQARYGEIREGYAIMVFVTEDFSTTEFTKADKSKKETIPVLKLNYTKNFTTGIYPYSIMTSAFVPFEFFDHGYKISTSIQEWCGHVYMELIRKKQYEFVINSYFEDESVNDGKHEVVWLEDEIWNQIRLYPQSIPEGQHQVIPPFSYLRLLHQEFKSYDCTIKKTETDSNQTILSLTYPDLDRTMNITFQTEFPRQIIRWQETYPDGFGESKKVLTSTGERIKTIRSAYWSKNKSTDYYLRKELGLE